MQNQAELIRQARGLFQSGDYDGAEQAYRDLIDELPEHKRVDLELLIGACQQAQGRDEQAMETILGAVEMDDSRAESWFQLALARRRLSDEKGASEALQRAIVLDPNHALARAERGRQCLENSDLDGAGAHFRTALRADPNCVPALVGLAEHQLEAGQLEKAQELASKAVQQQPRSVQAQIVMARVFRRSGHSDFAERCLDNALETIPDNPRLHAARAQLLLERGRFEECLAAVSRAKRSGSGDERLDRLEFQSLQQLGRIDEARRLLEQRVESQPLDPGALLSLADLRLETGDAAAAGELLDKLEQAWPAAASLMRARLAERNGERARAAELAASLQDEDDAHIQREARLLGAQLAMEEDDPDACIRVLGPLAGEDDPVVHWLLARSLDRAGRFEEAVEHLPHSGWYLPPLLRNYEREMPEALYRSLESIDVGGWDMQAPDDGRPEPVFVLGWHGSGRDSLLAALAENAGVPLLDRGGAQRRREALGLPVRPDDLVSVDDTQRRLARKRYFREAGVDAARVLEPLWLPVAALPAIARYFPGSTVILADAELRDLELDWRLAGFRGIETLRELWQREQAALEHLLEVLPLDFIVLSRGDLESDPGEVAAQLAPSLGIDDVAALADAIAPRLESLRPAGHWRHYRKLFEGRSVA